MRFLTCSQDKQLVIKVLRVLVRATRIKSTLIGKYHPPTTYGHHWRYPMQIYIYDDCIEQSSELHIVD